MQLNYRGIKYDLNAPVLGLRNSGPTSTNLKYRGNLYATNLPLDAAAADNKTSNN